MLKFQNKVVLVTGSGSGIGQEIAKKFAENGASLIILGRRKEPLERTAEILKNIFNTVDSNSFVKIFSMDVSKESDIENLFQTLKNNNINIDILINNAGVSGPVTCFSNAPLDEFRNTIDIHLTGTFRMSKHAIDNAKSELKIITISTFFTEEHALEQRPYRFRSPYTASQGAKNRLAEALAWETVDKKIVSIAINPGPVHSDRIYKTVYPKAASEFLRINGFKDIDPLNVENICKKLLSILGENEQKEQILNICSNLKINNLSNTQLVEIVTQIFNKIKIIAEKIQTNTSNMIADKQFLSQLQVADMVLNLCGNIGKTLNGKIIPGDRVFYPVKPHITTNIPEITQPSFNSNIFILTIDSCENSVLNKAIHIADHIEENNGKVICLISHKIKSELIEIIAKKFHSHKIDLNDHNEVDRWFKTAANKFGNITMFIHFTGNVTTKDAIISMTRQEWDKLLEKFIIIPAKVIKSALDIFAPDGGKDPRIFKEKSGIISIIGPDLPLGKKIPGVERARVEIFRGLLRPFITTINQELSDVLKSNVRVFLILPGSITGIESNDNNMINAINSLFIKLPISSEVIYQIDEKR